MRRSELKEGAYYAGRSIFVRQIIAFCLQRNIVMWADRVAPGECTVQTFCNWAREPIEAEQSDKDDIAASIQRQRERDREWAEIMAQAYNDHLKAGA